jgi:hypothetical protein
MAEAAIVGGPTIASTRDYRTLHLGSAGRADRTSSMLGAGHSEGEVMALTGWSDRSMLCPSLCPSSCAEDRFGSPRRDDGAAAEPDVT